MKTHLFLFAAIITLATACATMPKNTDEATRQVKCGQGPEDIVIDSSATKPRMLISCSARREGLTHFGEIMEYGFDGAGAIVLPRIGEPAGFVFNPHGIDIATVGKETFLYVVNHRDDLKQHYIVIYKVEKDKLVFEKQFTSAFLVSPNDCAADGTGGVYATNDSRKRDSVTEKLFRQKHGSVVYFNPSGTCSVVAEKLAYANGILVLDTNVFVSTVQQKALFKYKRGADGSLANGVNIAPYYGYDNITKNGDELIVVAHPKPIKFLKHMQNAKKPSPGITYAINYKTNGTRVLFADDGKRISCNATGLIYKGKLYIAQVFEPYILEVDLPFHFEF